MVFDTNVFGKEGVKMKEQRIMEMQRYIQSNHTCTLEQLCNEFNISLSTARRDIGELSKSGHITKVYGGVKFLDNPEIKRNEPLGHFKQNLVIHSNESHIEAMDRIAKAASEEVCDNEIIILGSGYTVYHMLKYLKDKKNLTIITNNLLIAFDALNTEFQVVLLGGDINKETFSVVGIRPTEMLAQLNAHKAFLGCNGITLNQGFTNISELETNIKRSIMQVSNHVYVLAEHEKFDKLSLNTFARLEDINTLVTDRYPSTEYVERFRELSLKVIVTE